MITILLASNDSNCSFQDFVPTEGSGPLQQQREVRGRPPENGEVRFHPETSQRSPSRTQQHSDPFHRQFSGVLGKVHNALSRNDARLAKADRRDFIRHEWQQVAIVVDRLLLVIFLGVTLGVTLGLFMTAPNSLAFFLGLDRPS